MQINEKNYEYFTPTERLNLSIAAIGRKDQEEVDRLQRSCLVRNWTARDLEYQSYFISYSIICIQFYTICADLFTRITAYSYTFLLEAQKSKNKEDKIAIAPNVKMREISDKQDALIAQLKAVYEGFYQFCDAVGLNGGDILKTINFGALDHDGYLSMEHVGADEECTKEVKELFRGFWKH